MSKRFIDIFATFFGMIILFPVFIIVAILIKVKMPGPVFFKQERTGRYGKPFMIYKFRSMRLGHGGNSISVKGENRITPLGAILRKYKIDELPELWNVFIGEMSLVGPRPDVPEYMNALEGEERKILELRPGITGPASLKYKNEEELLAEQSDPIRYYNEVIWPDKIRINLDYYKNRGFVTDMLLILKTVI